MSSGSARTFDEFALTSTDVVVFEPRKQTHKLEWGSAHKRRRNRSKVPDEVRVAVWQNCYGSALVAQCLGCQVNSMELNARVENKNEVWQAAHVIADARGGPASLDNLLALCSACNNGRGCGANVTNQLDRLWRRAHATTRRRNRILIDALTRLRGPSACSLGEFVRRRYEPGEVECRDELLAMLSAHAAAEREHELLRVLERERAAALGRAHEQLRDAETRCMDARIAVCSFEQLHDTLERSVYSRD